MWPLPSLGLPGERSDPTAAETNPGSGPCGRAEPSRVPPQSARIGAGSGAPGSFREPRAERCGLRAAPGDAAGWRRGSDRPDARSRPAGPIRGIL